MRVVEDHFGQAVRSLSHLVSYVEKHWQQRLSHSTLARWMKACRYRYKRMRKSTKHRRDAQRFAASKEQIATFHEQEALGELGLLSINGSFLR